MNQQWPTVGIGEILTERRECPSADDLASGKVRIVSKISFSTGQIELRTGAVTNTGMILARPGDLVISGINAAKGAVAIHGEENTESIAATIHYGAYTPRPDRADLKFLWWFFRSRAFRELLNRSVPGGIKTELKAKRLLPIRIPLPLLEEQRRIAKQLDELVGQIREAHQLRQGATIQTDALMKAHLRDLANELNPVGRLGDVLSGPPRNGWSARCDNAEDGTPVLSLSAVTGFRYVSTAFKRTSLYASPDGQFWLRPGDILITRSNSPELVGHAAIYDGSPTPCIYPDLMMRLALRKEAADPRFVWYWLQGPVVREFISKNAQGTSSTMKKISQGVVTAIPFPSSLSLSEQRRCVKELDVIQEAVDSLSVLQEATKHQLDSLLPAVIDWAVKDGRQ